MQTMESLAPVIFLVVGTVGEPLGEPILVATVVRRVVGVEPLVVVLLMAE